MAHFFRPPDSPAAPYDMDGKLAPDSVGRVRIPVGAVREVGLFGGPDLWVRVKNTDVVSDKFTERPSGTNRILKFTAVQTGYAEIKVGLGTSEWISLEVFVLPVNPSQVANFVPQGVETQVGGSIDANGTLFRQDVYWGERAIVGMKGSADVRISPKTPTIVEIGQEMVRGGLRLFPVIGVREGDAMVEATGAGGMVLASVRVHVNPKRPLYGAIATGADALQRASELIKLMANTPDPPPFPTQWGAVTIQKGQVWAPHKRLILTADHQAVAYLEGETLYNIRTTDLAREIMLDGMIDGMNRARPLVSVTIVVISFIKGVLFGPLVQGAAFLIVLFMFSGANWEKLGKTKDVGQLVFGEKRELSDRYPTLFNKIMDTVKAQMPGALFDAMKETVSKPENIAFFLGRVLRGNFFAPDPAGFPGGKAAKEIWPVTFKTFAKVTLKCAVLVTALHLHEGVGAALTKAQAELSQKVKGAFAGGDVEMPVVTMEEAVSIAAELLKFPDTKDKMEKFGRDLDQLQGLIRELLADWEGKKT
ncbi:MAG: hypothetical protein H7Y20_01835 [Bryobacteraceae bacterium]|nr:hypothetical protein [Bryobacteraceae bacterium]